MSRLRRIEMIRRFSKYKKASLLCMVMFGTILYLIKIHWIEETHPLLECYGSKRMSGNGDNRWLSDILKDTRQPQPGRTIFFHVTNCLNRSIELTNRQACAIESAANTNPERDIFVLFASPVTFSDDISLPTQKLMMYPNIHWRNVDLWAYAENTPAQEWIHDKSQLLNSKYFVSHASDYLRFVSLFRYGGTHLDLDFIMKKSISYLDSNYACAESDHSVGTGILNFDHTGFGHDLVEHILRELVRNYDGTSWANIGPELVTRVLQEMCSATITAEMNRERCNFNVLPQKSFYAVYPFWRKLFDEEHTAEVVRMTKESIAVHFWNSLTHLHRIRIGSSKPTAYELLAKEFCPRVYDSIDEYF